VEYNASIFYDKLSALNIEVKSTRDRLNSLQSALDRKVSEIYHEIEKTESLSMSESHTIIAELKKTLEHRRVVKDELKRLEPLFYFLRNNISQVESQHEKAIRKSYEIRESLNAQLTIDDVIDIYVKEGETP